MSVSAGQRGTVHISQVTDESAPKSSPLEQFKEGQSLKAIVLGRSEALSRFKARDLYDLSIKPSVVQGTKRAGKYIEQQSTSLADLIQGSTCHGYVITKAVTGGHRQDCHRIIPRRGHPTEHNPSL